jgi:hypothetical protein
VFMLAHDWLYGLHGLWFHLMVEQFDALHYGGMALYKIGILLFLRRTPTSRQKRARIKIDCYTYEPKYTAAGV